MHEKERHMPNSPLTPEGRNVLCVGIQEWIAAGYALVPIKPDSSKSPIGLWARIARGEERSLSTAVLIAMVRQGTCDGVAALMGRASGNAEMMEIEGRVVDRLSELEDAAEMFGIGHLFRRLSEGCSETTPSGGVHYYLRVSDAPVAGNVVLASRPATPHDLVLAETRGQGGYSIVAPSSGRTHETGRPYVMRMGSPANTPVFTAAEVGELHALFRVLDEIPPAETVTATTAAPTPTPAPVRREVSRSSEGLSPGDDFNARANWEELLEGWTRVGQVTDPDGRTRVFWRRPGKTVGVSASLLADGAVFYNFSTSAGLPTGESLSKFAVFAHLHHGGSFSAAAADLASRGYGGPRRDGQPATGGCEYVPFPIDVLPDVLSEFVRSIADDTGCDPSFVALPAITALASAIGNTRRLRLKSGWLVPPVLWTVLVGESGNQKTTGFRQAMAPIQRLQEAAMRRHKEACAEHEAALRRWEGTPPRNRTEKPRPPVAERLCVVDTTVEALAPLLQDNPRGLLLARDELRGWIGSFDRYASGNGARSDEAHWLSMYNGMSILVDRRTSGSVYVSRASVCITGGIQPGPLRRALGVHHRESGLAARLLMAYPPKRPKQWVEGGVLPEIIEGYGNLFPRLLGLQCGEFNGERMPIEMVLSPEARQLYIDFYNAHNLELADLTGDLAAAWAKLEELPARLGLVFELVSWASSGTARPPEVVDTRSTERAIGLTTWFKNETRRIYGLVLTADQTEESTKLDRLCDFLSRRGGEATVREVRQGCRFLRQPGQAEAAMNELATTGRGAWVDPLGTTGQASPRFRLSAWPAPEARPSTGAGVDA